MQGFVYNLRNAAAFLFLCVCVGGFVQNIGSTPQAQP